MSGRACSRNARQRSGTRKSNDERSFAKTSGHPSRFNRSTRWLPRKPVRRSPRPSGRPRSSRERFPNLAQGSDHTSTKSSEFSSTITGGKVDSRREFDGSAAAARRSCPEWKVQHFNSFRRSKRCLPGRPIPHVTTTHSDVSRSSLPISDTLERQQPLKPAPQQYSCSLVMLG